MQHAERIDARAPGLRAHALVLGAIAAAALALAGCEEGSGSSAGAAAAPPVVTVAHPLAQPLVEWTEFTGRFEAIERVEVRARVSGYLNTVDFRDGQVVEKGQVLFVIDPRPFEVAFERAQADVTSAEAQVRLADIEFQRISDLAESPAFSRSAYDQRLQEKQAAQAALAAAQAFWSENANVGIRM